jgi:hypothetical protein
MSSPGSRPYGVWSSTNLAAGWLLATGGLSRTPPTNAWSHPRPSAGYPYFYRVAVTN